LAEKVRVSAEEMRVSAEDSLQHCLSSHHVVLLGEWFQALLTSLLLQVTNMRIIKLAQKTGRQAACILFADVSKRVGTTDRTFAG